MSKNNFVQNRKQFASEIGVPDLYEHIDQFALYAGIHTIGNKMWTYELLKQTVGIPGDIYEFGCWKGANLMFLAKMSSLLELNSTKKVIGFDNFSGLPDATETDGEFAKEQVGKYCGNEDILRKVIDLFEFEKKMHLVVGDATSTIPKYSNENPAALCSFAYIDFDLYEPTKVALEFLDDCISVGGIIVFDEACMPEWPGETIAMKRFLSETRHSFEMISNSLSLQPTVAIKRVA